MGMNFPTSPAENLVYSPDGRAYYIFKSPGWRQIFAQRPVRNRIVNARMQASQVNGDVAGTTYGYYAADQWPLSFSNTPGAVSFRRVGAEGGRVLDIQVTTATASPDYLMFSQNLEGWQINDFFWGTAYARPAVLSFVFNSSISGQFSIVVRNHDYTRAFVWPFTVPPAFAGLWVQQTIPIPGDITGTWLADQRLAANVLITLAAGGQVSTQGWNAGNANALVGQVNGMATVGNLFRMTEAVLTSIPVPEASRSDTRHPCCSTTTASASVTLRRPASRQRAAWLSVRCLRGGTRQ